MMPSSATALLNELPPMGLTFVPPSSPSAGQIGEALMKPWSGAFLWVCIWAVHVIMMSLAFRKVQLSDRVSPSSRRCHISSWNIFCGMSQHVVWTFVYLGLWRACTKLSLDHPLILLCMCLVGVCVLCLCVLISGGSAWFGCGCYLAMVCYGSGVGLALAWGGRVVCGGGAIMGIGGDCDCGGWMWYFKSIWLG
jgi:hypothetical protein